MASNPSTQPTFLEGVASTHGGLGVQSHGRAMDTGVGGSRFPPLPPKVIP